VPVVAAATPKPVASSAPAPKVPPRPAATDGTWRIQFGAFGVAANADALWAKLRARPEVAGHPRINVPVGSVIKLQAGQYSHDSAQSACSKLSAAGFTCIASRN
jgi:cell division septation protein DedD